MGRRGVHTANRAYSAFALYAPAGSPQDGGVRDGRQPLILKPLPHLSEQLIVGEGSSVRWSIRIQLVDGAFRAIKIRPTFCCSPPGNRGRRLGVRGCRKNTRDVSPGNFDPGQMPEAG